jgi:hypothetical protein
MQQYIFFQGLPECICKESWGCESQSGDFITENGCPNAVCDGDDSWCEIQNSPCRNEELYNGAADGWAYCANQAGNVFFVYIIY